jgi:capsular polysaccharide transport system permease protein
MSTNDLNNSRTTLRRSFKIQAIVINALLLREIITRYGRHNIGFFWLFVEPMMFTLGVATLWIVTGMSHHSDLPIVAFALTGYSTVLLWRNMPSRCIGSIMANSSLMSHRNVRMMDIFLSRVLLEAIGASISFASLAIVFWWFDVIALPENLFKVICGWLLVSWFGASLAIALGALYEQSEMVEKIWHPAAYLLFPLSGAAFLVEQLPDELRSFVLWFPMVNGVELIRDGYFGSKFNADYSVSYMITFNLALTFLAVTQERKISKTLILE